MVVLDTKDGFSIEYKRWSKVFVFSRSLSHVSEAHDWGNNVGDIGSNFIVFPYKNKYVIVWAEKIKDAFSNGAVYKTGGDASHWFDIQNGVYEIEDKFVWFHPDFNKENNYIPTRGTWCGEEELEEIFDKNGYNEGLNTEILKYISDSRDIK
jgi:hypothetical protein